MVTTLTLLYQCLVNMFSSLLEIKLNDRPVSTNRVEPKPVVTVAFLKFVTDNQNSLKSARTAQFAVEAVFQAGRDSPYTDGLDLLDLLDDYSIKHYTSLNPAFSQLAIQDLIVKSGEMPPREPGVETATVKLVIEVSYIKLKQFRRITS